MLTNRANLLIIQSWSGDLPIVVRGEKESMSLPHVPVQWYQRFLHPWFTTMKLLTLKSNWKYDHTIPVVMLLRPGRRCIQQQQKQGIPCAQRSFCARCAIQPFAYFHMRYPQGVGRIQKNVTQTKPMWPIAFAGGLGEVDRRRSLGVLLCDTAKKTNVRNFS